jgi:zinc protease
MRINPISADFRAMTANWLALALAVVSLCFTLQAQAAVNIQHWQTSQGSDVYFVENHELPIIDLSVNFPAGSARDDKATSGLASLTRHMTTLGAGGVSEEVISKRIADVGAVMDNNIDPDRAYFELRTLSSARERDQALDVYTRILQQPDFPAEVLEREKARVIAGLRDAATQPESIASETFMSTLYSNHPYALNTAGEPAAVAALKREDLVKFYNRYYGAKGAVIAMIGDMSRGQAEQIAERISSGLPQAAAVVPLPDVQYPEQARRNQIPHPATQSHILLGYPGVKRGDKDYFPLYVGNYILGGGGFVSRLTEEVREKRGLVYSVYSYFLPLEKLGPFQVGLQTKTEQADEALKVVRETLQNFLQQGPTEAELKAAKQNIIGGFPLRLDSNSKILEYLAVIGFYDLPLSYLDDFNKEVGKVTTAQIQDAFNRRIELGKLATVIVGGDVVAQ